MHLINSHRNQIYRSNYQCGRLLYYHHIDKPKDARLVGLESRHSGGTSQVLSSNPSRSEFQARLKKSPRSSSYQNTWGLAQFSLGRQKDHRVEKDHRVWMRVGGGGSRIFSLGEKTLSS